MIKNFEGMNLTNYIKDIATGSLTKIHDMLKDEANLKKI
jgi:hypothetical protein